MTQILMVQNQYHKEFAQMPHSMSLLLKEQNNLHEWDHGMFIYMHVEWDDLTVCIVWILVIYNHQIYSF